MGKTIKVIDLLNKIANGEEIPKFRFNDDRYIYFMKYGFLHQQKFDGEPEAVEWNISSNWLNREAEIIEEDKEIEDTKYMRHHEGNGKCYIESKGHKYYVPYDLLLLIDDLVKAVNELKKGK